MSTTPLVIFAFAHERNETKPSLRNLLKEQLQITSLISPMVQQNFCESVAVVNVSVERLSEVITKEGSRVVGLHYASDVATLIRAREGKTKSMERAFKGKLGRTIGALPHMKWVFLNGDGGQEQAESLLQAGVPLVMRSHNLINDDAAFRLAYFFYQALGQGQTLGEACYLAVNEVRRDYINRAKLTYDQELPSGYGSDWPFEYHINPHLPSVLGWSLHHAGGVPAEGLPKLSSSSLPDLPFKDFEPLDLFDQQLFSGRDHYVRMLYDAVKSRYNPPIIVLSGPKGGGKTSIVRAQLSSLLNREYEVRYQPFTQDGLTTLSQALGVDENTPLLKEWFLQEGGREKASLKPQMITDLMNEVQASFRSYYRSEKADFTQFIRAVRSMWLREDAGEGQNLLLRLGRLFDQQGQIGQTINPSDHDPNAQPLFVCLDDLELSFGSMGITAQQRQKSFWELLRLLCVDLERSVRGAILLIVDETYLAQLNTTLDQYQIKHINLYLPSLEKEDVISYLEQFRTTPKLREHYPLISDERFPYLVAQDITQDQSGEIGIRLHAILRALWRRSSRRPVMWTEETYSYIKQKGIGLSDLLNQRVNEFIELMRMQGDDEFNDHLALDLLYQFSVCATHPKIFKEWARRHSQKKKKVTRDRREGDQKDGKKGGSSRVDSSTTLMGLNRELLQQEELSAKLLKQVPLIERGGVEVSSFLRDYLGWGQPLPEPWKSRQRSLADQGLWAFTQAIEIGLLRGRLSAGEELPSGVLSIIHPNLSEVLEKQWEFVNGPSSRQVQRFVDLMESGVTPSIEDLELTRRAFLHTRLPSVEEAELLVEGERAIEEREEKRTFISRQRLIIQWALMFLLLLVSVRCAYLNYDQEELASQYSNLKDQILFYASERVNQKGDIGLAAALLREIEYPEQIESWTQEVINILKHPLEEQRINDPRHWDSILFSTSNFAVKYKDNTYGLWSLQGLQETHQLGLAQHITHTRSGNHWATLDGSELKFWSMNQSTSTNKRIQPGEVTSLVLNDEGTVASLLYKNGDLHLLRSYKYPLKVMQGHQKTPIKEISLSPDGHILLIIDQRGVLKRFKINDEKQTSLIPPPQDMILQKAMWLGDDGSVIALYHGVQQSLIRLYKNSGAALNLYQGGGVVSFMTPSSDGKMIVLGLQGEELSLISSEGLGRKPLNINEKNISQIHINPNGRSAFFKTKDKTEGILLNLEDQHMPITLNISGEMTDVQFSPNGKWLMTTHQQGVQIWSADDGFLIQEYEPPHNELKGAIIKRDVLYTIFDAPLSAPRTHLMKWKVKSSSIKRNLYWPGDRITAASWHPTKNLIATANDQGSIFIWSSNSDQLISKIQAHQGEVRQLLFTPTHQHLLSTSADRSAALWQIQDGAALKRLSNHDHSLSAAEVSVDGKWIITGDEQGEAILWGRDGQMLMKWRAHKSLIRKVFISSEHKLLLTSSAQGESIIWRLGSGKTPQLLQRLKLAINDAVISKEGTSLEVLTLSAEGALQRWSVGGGEPLTLLEANEEPRHGKLRVDGRALLLSDLSGNLVLYDTTSRVAPLSIPHKAGPISSLAFLNDRGVVIGGEGGEVWVWPKGESPIKLGQHEGSVTQLITSPNKDLFASISETQSFLWRGPFQRDKIHTRLQQESQLCLKVKERQNLLNEKPDQARNNLKRCRSENEKTKK